MKNAYAVPFVLWLAVPSGLLLALCKDGAFEVLALLLVALPLAAMAVAIVRRDVRSRPTSTARRDSSRSS